MQRASAAGSTEKPNGEVSERLNELVSKTSVSSQAPGVQIPPSPPLRLSLRPSERGRSKSRPRTGLAPRLRGKRFPRRVHWDANHEVAINGGVGEACFARLDGGILGRVAAHDAPRVGWRVLRTTLWGWDGVCFARRFGGGLCACFARRFRDGGARAWLDVVSVRAGGGERVGCEQPVDWLRGL